MSDLKYMSIADFREIGYLQELNRRFLHPLGLALEVCIENDGSERLGGVWDYRVDPEGIIYGNLDLGKAQRIAHIEDTRKPIRQNAVGYWIQPVDED